MASRFRRLIASPRWTWPGLASGLALAAILLHGQARPDWDWQPGLAWSQPWRAWSAAAVHWSDRHLLMNLGACVVVGWLGWRAEAGRRATLAWFSAWPLTQFGLLVQPTLLHYGGLSGVLHAGVAVLAWSLWRDRSGPERWLGAAFGLGLLVKILLEQPWAGALRTVPGWDFALAPAAHASGAIAGAICAVLLLRRRRSDAAPA